MSVKHIITALGALACLLAAGVFLWRGGAAPALAVATVSPGKAVEAVYATATVEPLTWSAIAPIKTGRIVEISAKEGDEVKAGDILARLDDGDLRAQLVRQEALQVLQTLDLNRAKELIDKKGISQQAYDAAVSALAQTQAGITTIKEQISQLALTAPMDGTVLWRDVEPGEVKTGGLPIFWVGQPKPLRLKTDVDEEDIPLIRPGQNVLITADAFPSKILEGKVDWISPKGNTLNKSYRVYVALPDNTPLMIGMTVETNTITQEKENALLIPSSALIEGPAVWQVVRKNGASVLKKQAVTPGIKGAQKTEILSGLAQGDRVVTMPVTSLKDGQRIYTKE